MEFVQIPPQISQPARLHTTFVVRSDPAKDDSRPIHNQGASNTDSFWRPADGWENPIWGWILINYASRGIQVFLPDGTFYREVRLAGGDGTQGSPTGLHFAPDGKEPGTPEHTQLERLVARLGDEDFQLAFCDMIARATKYMGPVPDTFSAFANTLVGRPLALAHAGWSLELAGSPLKTQVAGDTASTSALSDHEFKVKVGDARLGSDGLVGMFNCAQDLEPGKSKDLGLLLHNMYSHFDHGRESNPTNRGGDGDATNRVTMPPLILPIEHISLRAFDVSGENSGGGWINPQPGTYVRSRSMEPQVRGLLFDPFRPVRTFSAILPVQDLSLPEWTWQGALAKMTAFFHMGPLVAAKDLPSKSEEDGELRTNVPAVLPNVDSKPSQQPKVLPDLAIGDWAWLQQSYQASGTEPPDVREEDIGGGAK